jgi:hypothetical protein
VPAPEAKDAPLTIQSAMLVALGFLAASLLALLVASAFWSRAVRLTTRRLKETLPVSQSEMRADLDRLRAAYAIRVHKLETQLEHAKLERARQLIEINRRDASVSALETDVVAIKRELDENLNARRVLEQTVTDRLPKVEARLAEAKRLLTNRDREIAELSQGARRQKAALEEASSINAQRTAEIERLSSALTAKGGRRRRASAGDADADAEVSLRTEAEALRAKTREQAALIDRLQRQLGEGFPAAAAALRPDGIADGQLGRVQASLAEAEEALQLTRAEAAGAPAAAVRTDHDQELRVLRARVEDQAGEIARLKAALAVFENPDERTGLTTSRLALKARAGSAEAQAERQAATIGKLRAELAAANERLAQQAAHFMDEMRRLGGGTVPASGQARRGGREGQRRRVAERAALVPERRSELAPSGGPPPGHLGGHPGGVLTEGAAGILEPVAAANGRGLDDGRQAAATAGPAAAAAEMPQTAPISEAPRKASLLDRITGLGKS